MKTRSKSIAIVILTTFLTSSAQIFLKIGVKSSESNFISLATNYHIIFGFLLYAIGGSLAIYVFRHGEVTVIYPLFATSYVWVAFSSKYFLGEELNLFKWIGILIIVAGVALLGFAGEKNVKTKEAAK